MAEHEEIVRQAAEAVVKGVVILGPPEESSAIAEAVLAPFFAAARADEREETERHGRHRACPCLHTTPCHPLCTCANGFQSRGCDRCASYGSDEQRKAAAESIVRRLERTDEAVAAARKEAREGALEEAMKLTCPKCRDGDVPYDSGGVPLHRAADHPAVTICWASDIWRALRSKPKEPA